MSKRFYHGAALLGVIGLCIVGILLVVYTNSFVPSGFSTGSTFYVEQGSATEPTWTNDYWDNPTATITLSYTGSNYFWARVDFTETGVVTTEYTLEVYNGTWYSLDAYRTYHSGYVLWAYGGDWSEWSQIRLTSTTDTTGDLPQRPSLAGE